MVLEIYTDGSSLGNPGPGGFGTILKFGKQEKEISQGYRYTTNNRMELMAVIVGLEAIQKEGMDILVTSDSQYVVNAVEKGWLRDWVQKQFKKKKNKDLWLRYLKVAKKHNVRFQWIKGHNDHPYNERCDQLAVAAAQSRNLIEDSGYMQETGSGNLFD